MRADGRAASTIARRLAAVRAYLRHLTLIGSESDNPAAGDRRAAATAHRAADALSAEAERLIDAAAGTAPRALRDRALVELLYGAGLRVSEAIGLVKASVDLEGRIVRVVGKGGKERLVPLGRPAAEALRRYMALGRPAPRPSPPPRPVPQRARRSADPRRRVPHPPTARRPRGARARARAPAPAASFVRHAPARGRRRPPQRPGDARPRGRRDDRAVHARLRPPPTGRVLPRAPARASPDRAHARNEIGAGSGECRDGRRCTERVDRHPDEEARPRDDAEELRPVLDEERRICVQRHVERRRDTEERSGEGTARAGGGETHGRRCTRRGRRGRRSRSEREGSPPRHGRTRGPAPCRRPSARP